MNAFETYMSEVFWGFEDPSPKGLVRDYLDFLKITKLPQDATLEEALASYVLTFERYAEQAGRLTHTSPSTRWFAYETIRSQLELEGFKLGYGDVG